MSSVTAATIETYDEFKRLITRFASGGINFLLVESPPGRGKSVLTEAIVDGDGLILDNAALSAVGLYMALHDNRDKPVVLADVDELLRSPEGRRIVAAITETRECKKIAWEKQNKGLENAGYPRSFETRSNVLLISNDVEGLKRRIPAILSRATYRRFERNVPTVLRQN